MHSLLTQHSRNIYYGSMVVLFLVLAPIVVLFAQGYRFSLTEGRIVHTGVIVLASQPSHANITLNGQPQEEQTHARFDNLRPGPYAIEVSREGYIPWTKTLDVLPGKSTIADGITLFRKDITPESAFTHRALLRAVQLNGSTFLLFEEFEQMTRLLYWFSKAQAPVLLGDIQGEVSPVQFNARAQKILLRIERNGFTRYSIGDLAPYLKTNSPPYEPLDLTPLTALLPTPPDALVWDKEDPTLLWALEETTLYKIDLFEETRSIAGHNVLDILATPKGLLRAEQQRGQIRVVRQNLRGRSDLDFLLNNAPLRLLTAEGNRVVSTDGTTTKLFTVLRPGVVQEETLGTAAKGAQWQGANRLLLWSPFELTAYNLAEHTATVIGRFGKDILSAAWYANRAYVLFTQEGRFTIREIDIRDRQNGLRFSVIPGTTFLGFADGGKRLWFFSPKDVNSPGMLWSVRLQ